MQTILSGVTTLIDNSTSPINSERVCVPAPLRSFQVKVTGSGDLTATVNIYGSNDLGDWSVPLGTFNISGPDYVTEGFVSNAPWQYVFAEVTDLTGTDAAVSVYMGV